ncbi:hypothetical protein EV127DRAFT_477279 [Xylaria flabelliformis]|nr:hypothetical protein EV127DRAFT_477279 [Xylaria flabelliformis]
MAAPSDRPYRHLGVFLPFSTLQNEDEWSFDEDIEREGFIYIEKLKKGIFVVQSIATGGIFVNKILRPDDGRGWRPEEFRFSTAPQADRMLPKSCIVRNRTRIYFIELELWHGLSPRTFSLYLKFYNGGCLSDFLLTYRYNRRDIPEHFLWHTLLTLIEAVRYLKFGALPGTDDEDPNWIPIHHRDIACRNVFIHYLPREGPEPEDGFEENAFPELILGDFGHGAVAGDREIKPGCWNREGEIAEWHDTYAIFDVVKRLCSLINDETAVMEYVNETLHEGELPYSDDLIEMLQIFEFPNFEDNNENKKVTSSQLDPATGRMVPNYSYVPTMRRVVDEFLPIIRDKVQAYRSPAGGIPKGWWKRLDVSWTKPDPFMPYEWMTQGLPNPNDTKSQGGKTWSDSDLDQDGEDKSNKENEAPNGAPNDESGSWSDSDPDSSSSEEESYEKGATEKVKRAHKCEKPNPVSVRKKLKAIVLLAERYKRTRTRPPHHVVQLEYGQPIMTEIRRPPRRLGLAPLDSDPNEI